MLSLVTVSPVITAFHSCCVSHHVFDQVNISPAWVGFETAIFWQCSPLSAAPRAPKGDQGWIFWSYKSLSGLPDSGSYRIFFLVLVFNWNHFEMRLLNLRINFFFSDEDKKSAIDKKVNSQNLFFFAFVQSQTEWFNNDIITSMGVSLLEYQT